MRDIDISRSVKLKNIKEITDELNIPEEYIEQYGKYKAKINLKYLKNLKNNKDAKLILVTAINPTPLGEGKTTASIGLADGLNKINKKTILALREPSLRSCIWCKGRCNWWWIFTSCTNGRYKFAFYRRYTCNYIS